MFGGAAPGEKENAKLKEVLGWADSFVKVELGPQKHAAAQCTMQESKFVAGDCLTLGDICLLATYSTIKVI
jgi:hypothetical protein